MKWKRGDNQWYIRHWHFEGSFSSQKGSLSNHEDDHGNNNVKNQLFYEQNNSSARASHCLVHFFDIHCTTTT